MVGESVGGDHLVNHEGLRGGHQVRIAAHLVGLPAALSRCAWLGLGIGPVFGHLALGQLVQQQGHRVLQVLVENRVVFDHGPQAGVASHWGAQGAQAVAALPTQLKQPQRPGRLQQALQGRGWHLALGSQLFQRTG